MHSLPTQTTRSGSLPCYSAIYQKVALARCNLRVMQMFLSSKQRSTLRDAFHSARRWYRSVSVTLPSHESRWQWLVRSARAKSQLQKSRAELSPAVCRNKLFLYAILGCNTTSRPYDIGKAAFVKKCGESVYFQDQAKVFDIPGSTQAKVATAGENALVVLYGGKQGESLDSLRYHRCYEKSGNQGSTDTAPAPPPDFRSSQIPQPCLGEGMQFEDWG